VTYRVLARGAGAMTMCVRVLVSGDGVMILTCGGRDSDQAAATPPHPAASTSPSTTAYTGQPPAGLQRFFQPFFNCSPGPGSAGCGGR
jgi:hypothetical protein